jgi:hypothetical protein
MNEEKKVKSSVDCRHCNSRMEVIKVKKYSGKWPLALVVTGVFCCLFFVGAIIGVPMLLLGIYLVTAEETISYCPNCGNYFKVLLVNPETGHGMQDAKGREQRAESKEHSVNS